MWVCVHAQLSDIVEPFFLYPPGFFPPSLSPLSLLLFLSPSSLSPPLLDPRSDRRPSREAPRNHKPSNPHRHTSLHAHHLLPVPLPHTHTSPKQTTSLGLVSDSRTACICGSPMWKLKVIPSHISSASLPSKRRITELLLRAGLIRTL